MYNMSLSFQFQFFVYFIIWGERTTDGWTDRRDVGNSILDMYYRLPRLK